MKQLFLICMAVLLGGCLASTGESAGANDSTNAPIWISGTSKQYSHQQYLTGVGSSPGQERAKDKARADLVKTFKVSIDSTSRLSVTSEQQTDARGSRETVTRKASRDIETSTAMEMKNIRIAETWHNPQTGEYFALAVLDKATARRQLITDIETLDADTASQLQQSNNANDALDRIGHLNLAIAAQLQREELVHYLPVLGGARQNHASQWSLTELQARAKTLQRQLPIGVEVHGHNAARLADYAKGGLAAAGYKAGDAEGADYILRVSLDAKPAFHRDNLYWMFANLEIALREAGSNKNRGSCSWSIKKASQSASLVDKKVLDAVQDTFATKFDAVLEDFINARSCE